MGKRTYQIDLQRRYGDSDVHGYAYIQRDAEGKKLKGEDGSLLPVPNDLGTDAQRERVDHGPYSRGYFGTRRSELKVGRQHARAGNALVGAQSKIERAMNGSDIRSNVLRGRANHAHRTADKLTKRLERLGQKEAQKQERKENRRQKRQELRTSAKRHVVSAAKRTGTHLKYGGQAVARRVEASGRAANKAAKKGAEKSEAWAQRRWAEKIESRKYPKDN